MKVLRPERVPGRDAGGCRRQEITPEEPSVEVMPRANIGPVWAENGDNDLPRWLLLRNSAMDERPIRRLQQHRALRSATKDLPVPASRCD
jgi:hypothetical protein